MVVIECVLCENIDHDQLAIIDIMHIKQILETFGIIYLTNQGRHGIIRAKSKQSPSHEHQRPSNDDTLQQLHTDDIGPAVPAAQLGYFFQPSLASSSVG